MWLANVKHLGAKVQQNLSEAQEAKRVIGDLYGRTNALIANYGSTDWDICCELFNLQCSHLYGATAWNLNDPEVNKINIAWNKSVRRVLGLPYTTHTKLLPLLIGRPNPVAQAAKRKATMHKTITKSDNVNLKYIINASTTHAFETIDNQIDDNTRAIAQAIIDIKCKQIDVDFSQDELNELLYILCCK